MIKLCVFDLDGTIANTITTIAYYGNRAMNKFGLPDIDKERYKILVGDGAATLVERMLREKNAYSKELFDKMLPFYVDDYDRDFMYLTTVYDGIINLLDELSKTGIPAVVLTNKPEHTAIKVVKTLVGDRAKECFGNRDGRPKKPDPTVLLEILEKYGVSGDECLYIGDTSTDMDTGNGGKCHTVGVLWGFRSKEELMSHNAEFIIEKPSEIIDIISKLK